MLQNLNKTPFPYFGGKADAAASIWEALGDPAHYAEPFAGSLAVLLRRPHPANRTYFSETVNDADGLLVNAWRSIQLSPDATAEAASNPVCEADLTARHLAIVRWREARDLERLMGDPKFHDPIIGGWWIWGISCWIGGGWCSGDGAWTADENGRIFKQAAEKGKERGVSKHLLHISDNGQGINRPQAREPGVTSQMPELIGGGKGINNACAREPGVCLQMPFLGNNGRGINNPKVNEPGLTDPALEFHPVTMPEVRRWLGYLSARLRHVRILNGDWKRLATGGALKMLEVRMKNGIAGVFLDPPYSHNVRAGDLYAVESASVAEEAREWCIKNGNDPDYRIVLAGYNEEHGDLENHGWTVKEWFKSGFLKGGMANQSKNGNQQHKERLWLSPHCLKPKDSRQCGFDF